MEESVRGRLPFERSTKLLYFICVGLLVIAAAAPIAAGFEVLKPLDSTVASWVQRSAAITTIFALLAPEVGAIALNRLYVPGTYGDATKLETYALYAPQFGALRYWAVCITILGTLLWGYGDLLPFG